MKCDLRIYSFFNECDIVQTIKIPKQYITPANFLVHSSGITNLGRDIQTIVADKSNIIVNGLGIAHHSGFGTVDGVKTRDTLGHNVGGGVGV